MERARVCTGSVQWLMWKKNAPVLMLCSLKRRTERITPRYAVLAPLMEGAGIGAEWMLCCTKNKSLDVRMRVLWVSLVSLKRGLGYNNNDRSSLRM
jgi:hypothetical protein